MPKNTLKKIKKWKFILLLLASIAIPILIGTFLSPLLRPSWERHHLDGFFVESGNPFHISINSSEWADAFTHSALFFGSLVGLPFLWLALSSFELSTKKKVFVGIGYLIVMLNTHFLQVLTAMALACGLTGDCL